MDHLKSYVVDRFEGAYAVLEDNAGRLYDVLREELPHDIREGDVMHEIEGEYILDEEKTKKSRDRVRFLYERLSKKE